MDAIRYYKLLCDDIAYTGEETTFLIAILQFDWIDEFNVFLNTNGERIVSEYVTTTLLPDDLSTSDQSDAYHIYSIFRCRYVYTNPSDNMQANWFFKVGCREFWTESINFKVLQKGVLV